MLPTMLPMRDRVPVKWATTPLTSAFSEVQAAEKSPRSRSVTSRSVGMTRLVRVEASCPASADARVTMTLITGCMAGSSALMS